VPALPQRERTEPGAHPLVDDLVTVVIPARNEELFIARCLDSIRAQTWQDLQIVVVDGDSEDRTREVVLDIARQDPRVELLRNPDRIIPRSLNLAVQSARGRWLIRVDAHAWIPTDYVERAVGHLSRGGYGGVGGRKDGVGVTPSGRAIAVAMGSKFGVGNSTYHHGERLQTVEHIPFGCYPTELVRHLGGWDEALAVNQDFEFDQRVRAAGHDLLFDPALRIDWHCRQSIPDLFGQYRRYGRGKVAVALLHPQSVSLRQVLPPVLVAALAASTLVAMRRPKLAAAAVAPYVLFLAAGTLRERRHLDEVNEQLRLPAAFAAMHLGWGVGFWQGVARRRRAGRRLPGRLA
jgi:succinoglycan biosynthesis protein ExoA